MISRELRLVGDHIRAHFEPRDRFISLPGRLGPRSLGFHLGVELVCVIGEVLVAQDFLGQVLREAVGIIEDEDLLARNGCLSCLFRFLDESLQFVHAALDCAREVFLFEGGDALDGLPLID